MNAATATIDSVFGFRIVEGRFMVDARDIEIDGLGLPRFSWGWVGLSVARASQLGVGGMILRGLYSACFRERGVLLSEVLVNELRQLTQSSPVNLPADNTESCIANTRKFLNTFRDYEESPNEERTHYILDGFADTLYGLWLLKCVGYRTYMTLATVRLAVLRERLRTNRNPGSARDNMESYFLEVRGFHEEMIEHVMKQAPPDRRHRGQLSKASGECVDRIGTSIDERDSTAIGQLMISTLVEFNYDDPPGLPPGIIGLA